MRNMHWWIVSDRRVRFSVLGYPEFFLVFDGVFNIYIYLVLLIYIMQTNLVSQYLAKDFYAHILKR